MNDDWPIGRVKRSLFMQLAAKKLDKFHAVSKMDNHTQIQFQDFTSFIYKGRQMRPGPSPGCVVIRQEIMA